MLAYAAVAAHAVDVRNMQPAVVHLHYMRWRHHRIVCGGEGPHQQSLEWWDDRELRFQLAWKATSRNSCLVQSVCTRLESI